MKIIKYMEVRVNGRISVDAPLKVDQDGDYPQVEKVINKYAKKGFKESESTDSYSVLVDYTNMKAVCVAWRQHLGVSDAEGNRIYVGSTLKKVIPEGEPKPEFNEWHVKVIGDEPYLEEYAGYDTYNDYKYERHKVESMDIFKSFIVC